MKTGKRPRRLGALWISAFILWLPFEDTEIWPSAMLALGACIWIGLRLSSKQLANWWTALAFGVVLGAAVPLLAITLMAFKSGLHGHGFADFTARQVWAMWKAVPFSLLAGGFLAVALRLFVARWGKAN